MEMELKLRGNNDKQPLDEKDIIDAHLTISSSFK